MKKAIGIDLGTTYSAVAIVRDNGIPEILPNSQGRNTTASVVLFSDSGDYDEPLVGEMAKHSAATAPMDVVQFVKRQMGDPNWRFESANGHAYTAEEVSAIILRRLKADAELALGYPVRDAVITVPAYFDDARRMATKQAGQIAGLNVLRVLNEPTAAAMSYGISSQNDGTALVYDLGGGTFDVTIMKIQNGEFDVLATDGNRNLGGFNFDNRLIEYFVEESIAQLRDSGIAIDNQELWGNDMLIAQIREKAEFAKISLSTVEQTSVVIPIGGKQCRIRLTRSKFEELTYDLLKTTEELIEDTMEAAGTTWADIDHLLLVGGSTRMPMVRDMVKQISGKTPDLNIHPDEAIALGAAIRACIEESKQPDVNSENLPAFIREVKIMDVTSQALGVIMLNEDDRDENFVVIPRNAKIPTKGKQHARTVVENQKSINVQVTQGDDKDVDYVTIVGSKDIPIPQYPKSAPFTVYYAYDIDQTVFVELYDETAQKMVGSFEVDRLANLNDTEVQESEMRIGKLSILS